VLGLGAGEIFLILAFALIFIGPKKLPELARSLGKGIREFQNAKDELLDQVRDASDEDDKKIVAPTPILTDENQDSDKENSTNSNKPT